MKAFLTRILRNGLFIPHLNRRDAISAEVIIRRVFSASIASLRLIRVFILAVALLAGPALRAQIVNDGATNTLINVTTNITGDVTVGTNGSFTLLVLSDNALLTNSANGLIGRNSGANSNEVRLLSASARWFMGGSLYVGNNGAANR